MKRRFGLFGLLAIMLMVASCSKKDNVFDPIQAGDYPLVSYALERSPKINRIGAGMDFIHSESSTDTTYFGSSVSDEFAADAVFFNLMAYYTDENGDVQSEGCPAILLSTGAEALEVGAGISFFESFIEITEDMVDGLACDGEYDLDSCKVDGLYDRDLVMAAYDICVIGNKFRTRILEIPDGTEETDVQPVFLIKTLEGGYVKFMVTQFKGSGDNKQKTTVQWQIMSE